MIHNLPSPKTTKKSLRVGRGIGTGKGGHTTGRGTKGQKSRTGYKKPRPGFEGGQNPLSKRLPKLKNVSGSRTRTRLFKLNKEKRVPIKLSVVANLANKGDEISFEKLTELGLISPVSHKTIKVKVLFDKDIDKALTFLDIPVSKTAQKAIEKAGGKVVENV
ncbi:50S ribosomal protein L15 [Candidatus Dojkabacteria bacterium]|uniref:Large ribosomal subunit protein uL15 n=1 Tax=Candidatus Dojkabacteria bacterium TaxID=2099670 RepID=A0A955IB74_9BACT|nr:50S ribosomal protein L15 [Candidatus Dojkabacteria bacterium]